MHGTGLTRKYVLRTNIELSQGFKCTHTNYGFYLRQSCLNEFARDVRMEIFYYNIWWPFCHHFVTDSRPYNRLRSKTFLKRKILRKSIQYKNQKCTIRFKRTHNTITYRRISIVTSWAEPAPTFNHIAVARSWKRIHSHDATIGPLFLHHTYRRTKHNLRLVKLWSYSGPLILTL